MRIHPFLIGLACFSLGISVSGAAVSQAALNLLRQAEIHRGVFPDTGLQWTVEAKSKGTLTSKEATLVVKTQNNRSLAEVVEPETSEGKKYLLADGTMYFYRPGTRRAVTVPPRQQVAGDAAIGDIASTSFLLEYHPVSVYPEVLNEERCAVFQLNAKTGVTASYSHIKLWVSEQQKVIRKAEFYTRTGRHIRTATFYYNATLEYDGESIPFLSSLTVAQLLGSVKTTVLHFDDYKLTSFPPTLFNKDTLADHS